MLATAPTWLGPVRTNRSQVHSLRPAVHSLSLSSMRNITDRTYTILDQPPTVRELKLREARRRVSTMYLLEASSIRLFAFTPNETPPYAILSHTWGAVSDEVLFADLQCQTAEKKALYSKVQHTCTQAIVDGWEYVWIDTCCIDKSSSAELSEAINSMYLWYKKAKVCYAYLSDLTVDTSATQFESAFAGSKWFTRGWTLQELLAPPKLVFFNNGWVNIGRKTTLHKSLSEITGIEEEILVGAAPLESASVAKRMSWAARRKTTRPEDIAYCLMGIFSVNMPMLYGEGERAFLRLQEEIMKQSDDQSLFAWVDEEADPDKPHGLLAKSPSNFGKSDTVIPYQDWEPRPPYSMTNRGLRIDLHLNRLEEDIYVATIDCPAPPDYEDSSFLAIYLRKLTAGDHQYARVKVGQFGKVGGRGRIETIYVRQSPAVAELQGVFPRHVFQLRKGPSPDEFRVIRVITPSTAQKTLRPILSSRAAPRSWVPEPWPLTFRIAKEEYQLAGAIVFERYDKERLLIMLGSTTGFGVAFDAIEMSRSEYEDPADIKAVRKFFNPRMPGTYVTLDSHRVRVDAEPQIHNAAKYYMVDVEIDAIYESFRPLQAVAEVIRDVTNREISEPSHEVSKSAKSRLSSWRRFLGR